MTYALITQTFYFMLIGWTTLVKSVSPAMCSLCLYRYLTQLLSSRKPADCSIVISNHAWGIISSTC